MEDEHSAEFFDERQKMLEREAEESQPVEIPAVVPQPIYFSTLESLLDFIRKNSV